MTNGVRVPYSYLVLRCVPRVEREEFINVGVVVYCQAASFLACASHLDVDRLHCLAPELDIEAVREALLALAAVCRGDESAGLAGAAARGRRFGFVAAPRSTVVQPSPVHGGLLTGPSADPDGALAHLLALLVRAPPATRDPPAGRG